jgi:hypothetical protein
MGAVLRICCFDAGLTCILVLTFDRIFSTLIFAGLDASGRSAVRLARLTGGQEVGSSNLLAPTNLTACDS